jgi:ATP-dependent DNA helicase RecG
LSNRELSTTDLMASLGLLDRKHFIEPYLHPALGARVIEPTIPAKPRSPKQKYRRAR